MATKKPTTPLDDLNALKARTVKIAGERHEWSRQRGDAERALAELPERRKAAIMAQALEEPVEMPAPDEAARFHATISAAVENDDALRAAERRLGEDEDAVIDANREFFDSLAEDAARAADAALDAAVVAVKEAEIALRRAVGEWGQRRRSRIRMRVDAPPETLAPDFDGPVREVERAREMVWPGRREEYWREFRAREQAPQFGGEAA